MFFFRRERSEPGALFTTIEAIFGIGIGVGIAAAWLIVKPVNISDSRPSAQDLALAARHDVWYVPGQEIPVRVPQWTAKQRAFLDHTVSSLELTEQDLNRWMSVTYGETEIRQEWPMFDAEMRANLPLFRFDGSVVEAGWVLQLECGEWKRALVLQTRGAFENRGEHPAFVVESMRIGSCPIPSQAFAQYLFDRVASAFVLPDDTRAAWATVEDIRVDESRMKLGLKPAAPAGDA